jgi:hypothetical protein
MSCCLCLDATKTHKLSMEYRAADSAVRPVSAFVRLIVRRRLRPTQDQGGGCASLPGAVWPVPWTPRYVDKTHCTVTRNRTHCGACSRLFYGKRLYIVRLYCTTRFTHYGTIY